MNMVFGIFLVYENNNLMFNAKCSIIPMILTLFYILYLKCIIDCEILGSQ